MNRKGFLARVMAALGGLGLLAASSRHVSGLNTRPTSHPPAPPVTSGYASTASDVTSSTLTVSWSDGGDGITWITPQ